MTEETQNKKGFNVGILLNVVLLIGLAVLYVLYFTDKNKGADSVGQDNIVSSSQNIPSIAFVNSDSLLTNYEMYKEMQEKLEAKQKKLEGQVNWQRSQFEKEAQAFYEKIQSGGFLTRESAEKEQMRLAEKEQQVLQMSQKLGSDLANYEVEWHNKVLDTITNFLRRYNQVRNYDYILGYARGGGILLANDTLDITNDVLEKMNSEYVGGGENEDNEEEEEAK